jgi:fructose-bisphosphate aldolase class 1
MRAANRECAVGNTDEPGFLAALDHSGGSTPGALIQNVLMM